MFSNLNFGASVHGATEKSDSLYFLCLFTLGNCPKVVITVLLQLNLTGNVAEWGQKLESVERDAFWLLNLFTGVEAVFSETFGR